MPKTKKPKKPSLALRRHYAPIIELATSLIVNAPPQTSGVGDKATLCIVYPIDWVRGDFCNGLPVGRTDTTKTIKYDCKKLLKWFQDKGYIDYNGATLFAQRLPVMMMLAQGEQDLERMLDKLEVKEI